MDFYFYFSLVLCVGLLEPVDHVTAQAPETLKLVHLLYRHGDRTPVQLYPNDPYQDRSNWPVSWGQLLNEGKQRHFVLGQFVRDRYEGFLSDSYDPDEIVVRSTDVDRTLMSAQSHLAGLFPPTEDETWNPSLKWQPIPVHTRPRAEDYILTVEATCPLFDKLQDEFEQSQLIRDIVKDNKDLFEYLSVHSGNNVTRIVQLEYIYDVLFIESRLNKALPDWTVGVFPDQMKNLSDFSFAMKAYTHEMQRLKGGPLVKEIVSHYKDHVQAKLVPSTRKVFMYSAHDTTIAVFLSALQIFNNIQPPYSSLVMVELHQAVNTSDYYVQVLYKNVTDVNARAYEPYLLTIPGCTPLCPLDEFVQLTASVISDDVKKECNMDSPPVSDILTLGNKFQRPKQFY